MSSSPPLVVADRYRLVAPLGQGGMGRVWRATDVVLHREVAIKELVPPPGLTPAERQEMRERSLREARAIARLNNINVVRVFDVLSTDADPWIVMEYVPSRSLQDILAADGPFNPLRTAEIGLGVLNALRAAHRNGVVHRDVKPGNVLIGGDGRVVLTDFGLATVPGDPNVTRTGLVLGSPAYIAPERARDGTAGPAADLWSLGATLFAAVEGQSPFARPSAIATLAALATENVPVSRNAGPLKPVLNGLLRKDPAHRINAEEAERLLNRAAGRRSKITFPMSPTMRRPGVGRERPSLPSGPGGPPVLPGSGWVTATGSAPVVPNPRPPVAQPPAADGRQPQRPLGQPSADGRQPQRPLGQPPVDGRQQQRPLGQPPVDGRQPQAGGRQPQRPGAQPPAADGRPAPFAQGKAQVGGQVPPVGRDGKPLDPTRLDTPPVRDSLSGTRQAPPTAPQGGPARPQGPSVADGAAPTNALRTGFTAADVAANRRKQAAPEHERSLAQATAGYPVVTPRGEQATTGEAETQAEKAPATEPEGGAKATTGSETKAGPASGADAGSGSKADAGSTAGSASKAGSASGAEAGSASKAEIGSTAGSEPMSDSGSKSEPATGAGAEAGATSAGSDAESKTEATVAGSGSESEATSAGSGYESEAETTVAGTDPESEAETTSAETGSEPKSGTDDGTESESQAETTSAEAATDQAKAEAEAEAESEEEPPAEAGPESDTEAAEPEKAKAEEAAPAPELVEEKTSVLAAPPVPEEKTTLLAPTAKTGPAPEEKTTLLAGPAEEKTTMLAVDDDRTSVVNIPPRRRPVTDATRVGDLETVPDFGRPSRPAWTPMQMRPTDRRGTGVTIFGTTLTRRQAAIGLGIVMTFVLLVGIILVQAFGSDGDGDKKVSQAKAGASAPAQQPGGGKTPDKPSASAGPSPSSSPTAAGLPDGWRLYKGSNYVLPVPDNASNQDSTVGGGRTFGWGDGRQIRLDIVDTPVSPVQYLKDDNTGGYDEKGPTKVEFKGYEAADIEYFRGISGGAQHVVRRAIQFDGKIYVLTWYTEDQDWEKAKPDLKSIYEGFEPRK